MKYQLIIQINEENGFHKLIEIEETLINNLTSQCEVDRHDIGSGQMNIFIYTLQMHSRILLMLDKYGIDESTVKIAYRDCNEDNYIFL